MNHNKRRLGRGLASLLGTEEGGFEPSSLESAELMHLAIDQIDANPYQPRKQFDPSELAALADSLRQHGMLQPVLVRAVEGRYQLIASDPRAQWKAALHLGVDPTHRGLDRFGQYPPRSPNLAASYQLQ